MAHKRNRTHRTSLTDDELLLMDVLFDKNLEWRHLVREGFDVIHNLPSPHGFRDAALRRKLTEWLEAGLLRFGREVGAEYPDGVYEWFGLTERGGHLWEVERQPQWDRYCTDSFWWEDQQNWLSVLSPSLHTARTFFERACHGCLYAAEAERPEKARTIRLQQNEEMVPWKVFPEVYQIQAPANGLWDVSQPDWRVYESRRIWWRSVEELLTLRR